MTLPEIRKFVMDLKSYLFSDGRGAQTRFAKKVGASQPEISDWAKNKREVPIIRCVQIEKATNGAVTRKDLRPKDWHLIWPELADK